MALVLAITSVWNDSPIVDEIPHIGAGYSYVAKGDYRLNPEHPPLAKDLAGLALGFLDLNHSAFTTKYWTEDVNGQWDFGRNFIFNSDNDAQKISRTAKAPMFIFFVLSAILIFVWSKKLDGAKAGLLALFLFSFSPTVLAHSRFVTTDVPALFGVLLSSYFFIRAIKEPGRKNILIAGVTFGIAQLTKFSLFLLVPYFIFIALVYGWLYRSQLRSFIWTVLVIIIGYVVVVWPIYGLHVINYPPEKQKSDTSYLLGSHGNRFLADRVIELSDKPIIRPMAQYGLGLLMVTQRSAGGNTAYFLGEIRNTAWKEYFPFVYLVKEPLPFWILVFIALFGIFKSFKIYKLKSKNPTQWVKDNFDKFTMLIWLGIYWYTSIASNLNIGVRHLLPVYGFTYILLAEPISKIIKNVKIKNPIPKFSILIFAFYILFAWYLIENLRVYPYYLTYFNQLAGGPAGGHRYVVDSNLDWGQDAKRLADWIRENKIEEKIYLDYFGWADPNYYYKDKYAHLSAGDYKSLREFLNDNPQGGWVAISATFYMNSREKPHESYAWLDPIPPTAVIGNSIFVWHIIPHF